MRRPSAHETAPPAARRARCHRADGVDPRRRPAGRARALGPAALDGPARLLRELRRLAPHDRAGPRPEVVLQGGTRTVDDQGHVTTEGGKAAPNPLLPVIDRAHRSLQVALEELLRPAPWALAPAPAPVPTGAGPSPSIPGCAIPTRPPRPMPPSATTGISASSGRRRKYGKSMGSRVASSSAGRRSTPG